MSKPVILCGFDLCSHCCNVHESQGNCNHPNGDKYNLDNKLIILTGRTVVKCKLYSNKSVNGVGTC